MIDKIEAMVERGTDFRGELNELRRGSPWDPYSQILRPSKFYKAVADLRPLGFDAMLHIDQKRYGTHKVELLETGKKGIAEIHSTLERIVDCDPGGCRLGRIDLATDVRDVPLSWFRDHTYVEYKQFLCSHMKIVEAEGSEMGKKVYQTLYFGKRPSCVRIYDKTAERIAHFELWKKREIRVAKRAWAEAVSHQDEGHRDPLLLPEFPTVAEWLSIEIPEIKSDLSASAKAQAQDLLPGTSPPEQKILQFPVITRVENQLGGRVPESLQTVNEMRKNVLDFNPFARMRIVTGNTVPPGLFDRDSDGSYRFGVSEWCFYMYVRDNWRTLGAAQMWSMLNRDRNGKLYLRKMRDFLPVEGSDSSAGVSESELYERYRGSITRQLAA
jgi:Replication initiation factor